MAQILGMALPFFGLILLGYLAGKFKNLSLDGLAWLNFFIVYIALPALFFNLLSQTPVEKLASWGFIFASLLGTYCIFVCHCLLCCRLFDRRRYSRKYDPVPGRSLWQHRLYGTGFGHRRLGAGGGCARCLDLLF